MYHLLFTDDEPLVLDSVRLIVNQYCSSRFTVATATSGREAIEYVNNNPVDLVFIDILMPGLSGIETIIRIREKHPNIKFVVVSAYDDFDYAKQAVELGVIEYILKPINKKILLNCLTRCEGILSEEQRKEQLLRDYEAERRHVLPLVEAQLLSLLLHPSEKAGEIDSFSDILGLDYQNGVIICISCVPQAGSSEYEEPSNMLEQQLRSKNKCILQKNAGGQMVVLMSFDAELSKDETRRRAAATMQRVVTASEKQSLSVRVGIGSPFRSIGEVKSSYEQARTALNTAKPGECCLYHSAAAGTVSFEVFPQNKENQLLDLVSQGSTQSVALFTELIRWHCDHYHENLRSIQFSMLPLLNQLLSMSDKSGAALFERNEIAQYNRDMLELPSVELLEQFFVNLIRNICARFTEDSPQNNSGKIAEITQYIESHYRDNITLESLARRINYSPAYLSHIFHKHTQMRLIDYVSTVRMQKANELLLCGKYSVKEVADLVGYSNANYFCRLYKKMFGITVTEYVTQQKTKERKEDDPWKK